MTDKLKKIIEEEIGKLPARHQKAIGSLDWAGLTESIAARYDLLPDEINDLQVEVLLVLTGLSDPEIFASTIEDELGLTAEEAQKIGGEITEKILIPINDLLAQSSAEVSRMEETPTSVSGPSVILAEEYSSSLEGIGRKNGLNIEEMGEMEKVVTGVIKGEIKAENMNASLARALPSLSEEKISSLSAEINDQILRKIREKMKAESSLSSSSLEDKAVLNKAGIEILEEGMTPAPTPPAPKAETKVPPAPKPAPAVTPSAPEPLPVVQTLEIEGETLKVPEAKPIWAQKLTAPVQAKSTKTEHSPSSVAKDPSPTKTYPKGQDPYRLPPI